ncbi:MAG: LON peptidase substrate-binding domain-containing protein [Geminicoccaceae bacterium]|nr:LON peptidase substrate-binding domain-containing protein [Geminicoccaceae bacterium]
MGRSIGSLPRRFPIFPLSGTVLLPRGNLPLNIFEPRYLAMVRDAMQTDQVIGMIQPRNDDSGDAAPELYRTGCVGKVSNFQETDDGRFLITLAGICRFDMVEELDVATPYRQIEADFSRWTGDFEPETPPDVMRTALLEALKVYFDQHDIEADWNAVRNAPLIGLITSLAMICPFEASEKQALLEAETLERQARLLVAMMQIAVAEGEEGPAVLH